MRPDAILAAVGIALCLAAPVAADGLEGRAVRFNSSAWEDPARPFLMSQDYVGRVGPGPEFSFLPESAGGLVVVPVVIDVSADRIEFTYPGSFAGVFAPAAFNGYILTFPAECTLVKAAYVDPATTLPLTDDGVTVETQRILINVQGMNFDAATKIVIGLDVTDCILS